jgi:hypothetical protein|nr:MAG TPA: hypothetical protein [Caudoviricetes sp.]
MPLPNDEPVYLHIEQVNGRSMIVDQEGRKVAGVVSFSLDASFDGVSIITATIESATYGENGKIHITTGA